MNSSRQRGLAAPYALVTGFGALFALGTVAAGLHGKVSPTAVLIVTAAVVTVLSFLAEPLAAIPLGIVGWLCAVGFSHPPYGQLRLTGPFAGRRAIARRSRVTRSWPRPPTPWVPAARCPACSPPRSACPC